MSANLTIQAPAPYRIVVASPAPASLTVQAPAPYRIVLSTPTPASLTVQAPQPYRITATAVVQQVGTRLHVGSTPPPNPIENDLWLVI